MFGELGCNLDPMPIHGVYRGMDTGLGECSVFYPYFTVASKRNELIDTITGIEFASLASLTPEQQQVIP